MKLLLIFLLFFSIGCTPKEQSPVATSHRVYSESIVKDMSDKQLRVIFNNFEFNQCGSCPTGGLLIKEVSIRFLNYPEGECRPASGLSLKGTLEDSIRNACRSWWDLEANHEKFDKYAEDGMLEMFDEFDQKYYSKKYQKALLMKEQKSMELNTK
jgi:hypothetical protein